MKNHQPPPSITTDLEALANDFDRESTLLQKERAAIKRRQEDLVKRHRAISNNHGGADIKPSDMITLNVSGTEMFVRRDTLTTVKGSRLEALFSGRWENRLLHDEKGRVFMDADPVVFGKIIKYLKMVKLSASQDKEEGTNTKPPSHPSDSGSYDKKMFDLYLDIFHLQDNTIKSTTSNQSTTGTNQADPHIQSQKTLIAKMKLELDEAEKRLQQEESFVACFVIKKDHQAQQEDYSSDDSTRYAESDDSSGIIIDADAPPSSKRTERTLDDEARGILNLYVDGDMLAVKRSTLLLDPESKLAQDFSNDDWLYDHKVTSENGKTMFVVDHSSGAFKAMVHHLQAKSMIGQDDETCLPRVEIEDKFEREYFGKMFGLYFGQIKDVIKVKEVPMDTIIMEDSSHEDKIKEWLQSVNKRGDPKLLYRASRDGWNASDFHAKCDDKGATLVLVKSEEGYMFGGYSDVSWKSSGSGGFKSSKEAFLFSLKCHAGLDPVKMNIKKGCESNAVYHYAPYGPIFGQGGHDIVICSNSNTQNNSYTNSGNSYELPNGTTNPYFLTDSKYFKVSEYEVFQV